MLAPIATLAFLLALWIVAVAIFKTLEESGAKIAAALAGRSTSKAAIRLAPIRLRQRQRWLRQQPLRAQAKPRAAA